LGLNNNSQHNNKNKTISVIQKILIVFYASIVILNVAMAANNIILNVTYL
jgi:hypothetical protein